MNAYSEDLRTKIVQAGFGGGDLGGDDPGRSGLLRALRLSASGSTTMTDAVERRAVRVRLQLTGTKSGLSFTIPKNGNGRNVAMMDIAATALKAHRKRQSDERSKMGDLWQDTHLVFTSITGSPLDVGNLTNRSFRPLLERAVLPCIPFHDLRHTFATLFLSNGTHPKIVQEMLGHANISMTLATYSHSLPNMQVEAVDKVENDLF